jgi:3-deoxy-D-manno-octulosonic-acid transferase
VRPGTRCHYNTGLARCQGFFRALSPSMYFLYSVLTAAGMILLSPYLAVQGLRRGKYFHSLRQRMGYLPAAVSARAAVDAGVIWIHAVSVGEAFAAVPLARGLKNRFPQHRLVVSTSTATGQRVARERLDFADAVFYFPLDWAGPVRRAFRAVNPSLVIVLETEIWPHFLREARRRDVPVAFVNARISERSFRGYRLAHRLVPSFLTRVLSDGEVFLAQSEDDARRLRELGAPEESVKVTGNLKYDCEPPALGRLGEWLAAQTGEQERWPIVMAGSVVADEEEPVLAAYDAVQRQWRRSLLVLAPRKPERFDAAAQIVADRGWKVVRRSSLDWNQPLAEDADVLLLDSIGELAGLYSLADAVFVGGSLVPAGGHNILEPAWFSRPPVFGPSMDNFRDAAAQFLAADAAVQMESSEALGRAWVDLIRDEAKRAAMGRAARALVERNRGATARTLVHLTAILERGRQRA